MKTTSIGINTLFGTLTLSMALLITGCVGSDDSNTDNDKYTVLTGTDRNRITSPLLSLNPAGPGGSPNQSLRGGDVIAAAPETDSLLIGGLGVDVLIGNTGNDILIGGTEDFNGNVDGDDNAADNRDRAFGYAGDDVFIWAPGDGSDFFDGGDGIDVLVFGVLGELTDSDGSTDGDGLRVAVSINNVEYVVCTPREVDSEGGLSNIEVIDLTTFPASVVPLSHLPSHVSALLR